jgi:hypothetical protein
MAPIKQSLPPELERLIQLGKRKKLWALEIRYNVPNGEAKLMHKRNMEVAELMSFRENMFKYGFKVMVAPDHWKIICPMDIVEVDLYKQDYYIFEAPKGVEGIHE